MRLRLFCIIAVSAASIVPGSARGGEDICKDALLEQEFSADGQSLPADPAVLYEKLDKSAPGRTVVHPEIIGRLRVTRKVGAEEIASLSLSANHGNAKILKGIYITVEPDYQGQNLYTLLFAKALLMKPQAERIVTELEETNLAVFKQALGSSFRKLVNRKMADLKPEELDLVTSALEKTPAYRVRKKFGFTRLLDFEIHSSRVSWTVGRQ